MRNISAKILTDEQNQNRLFRLPASSQSFGNCAGRLGFVAKHGSLITILRQKSRVPRGTLSEGRHYDKVPCHTALAVSELFSLRISPKAHFVSVTNIQEAVRRALKSLIGGDCYNEWIFVGTSVLFLTDATLKVTTFNYTFFE